MRCHSNTSSQALSSWVEHCKWPTYNVTEKVPPPSISVSAMMKNSINSVRTAQKAFVVCNRSSVRLRKKTHQLYSHQKSLWSQEFSRKFQKEPRKQRSIQTCSSAIRKRPTTDVRCNKCFHPTDNGVQDAAKNTLPSFSCGILAPPPQKKDLEDVIDDHYECFHHGEMLPRETESNYPDWLLLASYKRRSRDIQEEIIRNNIVSTKLKRVFSDVLNENWYKIFRCYAGHLWLKTH